MSYIVGSSYVRTSHGTEIVLTVRDENLRRSKVFIPYSPYFFITEEDYITMKYTMDNDILLSVVKVEDGYMGIDGKRLQKVTVHDPSTISKINQLAKVMDIQLYESNLPFHYRFLIDNKIKTGIKIVKRRPLIAEACEVESRHRIVFIDIEVLKNMKPNASKDPVLCIGLYDALKHEFHSIFVGADFEFNLEETLKSSCKTLHKYPCKDEFELFAVLAQIWGKISPDIVSSFSPFDMTYLVERMTYLQIKPDFLSPVYCISQGRDLKIHCLHVIDYAELYRKVFGEPVWNTLDYIANKELGYGKIEVADIVETWRRNYTKIIEYNLRDVELLKDIEEAIGIIDNYLLFVWKETGLDLSDCLIPNRIGDILHMRYVNGKYIFFSESPNSLKGFEGGLVSGTIGLHYNIGVFDWNELYPSIMEMFHISVDTFDPNGAIKISGRDIKDEMGIKWKKICEEYDIGYNINSIGWTNELMKPFRLMRQKIKAQAKATKDKATKRKLKTLSAAIKVINNGLYGLYGQKTEHFTSRFYDPRIAGSIPYLGRIISEEARKAIEAIGYKLIYRDTDSLFIQLNGESTDEISYLKQTIEDHLTKFINDTYGLDSKLRMDYECTLAKVIIFAKKRYQGITTDGEIIVKGLNIVRKDQAKVTVSEQEKVGKMRMDGLPVEDIKKYIDQRYNDVKHKREPLENVVVMGKCTKKKYPVINRNYKAIAYAETHGINIDIGERFYWVYLHPTEERIMLEYFDKNCVKPCWKTKPVETDVIGFKNLDQLPERVKMLIDYKRMAEYVIQRPLEPYIREEKQKTNKQSVLSSYW